MLESRRAKEYRNKNKLSVVCLPGKDLPVPSASRKRDPTALACNNTVSYIGKRYITYRFDPSEKSSKTAALCAAGFDMKIP